MATIVAVLFVCLMAVFLPPATGQSFLEIADSVRDRPVPRPSPNSVPEFILIAEMANQQNRRTTTQRPGRPNGGLPDFLAIGESANNMGGRPTTSMFQMPSPKPPHTTPIPPEITIGPDVDFNEFTRPVPMVTTSVQIQETTPLMEVVPDKGGSSTEDSQMTTEDFDEDKIYFEEWDKIAGDPR